MISEARKIIAIAKSNINQIQGYLKNRNSYDPHIVRTFKDAIDGDKELIKSMNGFIKDRL